MVNKKPAMDRSKKRRILLLAAAVLSGMVLIGFYKVPLLNAFVRNLIDAYLTFLEQIADRILNSMGSEAGIREHQVLVRGEFMAWLDDGYLLKKWTLLLLFLFWVTPTSVIDKVIFTGILAGVNFSGSLVNIGLTAHLLSLVPEPTSIPFIGRTPYLIGMLSLLVIWIWRKRREILHSALAKKFNLTFLEKKLPAIFIVIFLWALLGNLFLGLFKYTAWINLLFNITAWILNILNYPASVESKIFLVGAQGSIFMAKPCLGFNTMLLFAAVVYLTGRNSLQKWLFILGGLVLINVANIARFVLLFIHIQKHGGYVLEMDIHAIYNYVIYVFVFVLWIIWFETGSYLKLPETFPEKKR
jgi:exosortase/archaeosortase family protein